MSHNQIQSVILNQANNSAANANQMTLNFPFPYASTGEQIALANLFINYSWFNITSAYGNNTCAYIFNGTSYPVTFTNGFYQASDISGYIQNVMFNNGHYLVDNNGNTIYYLSLVANYVYYGITLTCTPLPTSLPTGWTNPHGITLSGYTPSLVVNNSAFGKLIGYNNLTTPATYTTTVQYQKNSDFTPQISPVTTINVACNMVNSAKFNTFGNVIYSFSPNVTFGSQIQVNPPNYIWFGIVEGQYSQMQISFMDQNYNPLQINDTNITLTLMIRKNQNYGVK